MRPEVGFGIQGSRFVSQSLGSNPQHKGVVSVSFSVTLIELPYNPYTISVGSGQ